MQEEEKREKREEVKREERREREQTQPVPLAVSVPVADGVPVPLHGTLPVCPMLLMPVLGKMAGNVTSTGPGKEAQSRGERGCACSLAPCCCTQARGTTTGDGSEARRGEERRSEGREKRGTCVHMHIRADIHIFLRIHIFTIVVHVLFLIGMLQAAEDPALKRKKIVSLRGKATVAKPPEHTPVPSPPAYVLSCLYQIMFFFMSRASPYLQQSEEG